MGQAPGPPTGDLTSVMAADREIQGGSPPGNMTGPLEMAVPRLGRTSCEGRRSQQRGLSTLTSIIASICSVAAWTDPIQPVLCVLSRAPCAKPPASGGGVLALRLEELRPQSRGSHLAQPHTSAGVRSPGHRAPVFLAGEAGGGRVWFMGDFRYFCFVTSVC